MQPTSLVLLVAVIVGTSSGSVDIERRLKDAVDSVIKQVLPYVLRSVYNGPTISPECTGALLNTISGIRELQVWAFQMLDASGKIPAGLLEGTTTSLGSYDQCLRVTMPNGATGQYCTLLVNPLTSLVNQSDHNRTVTPGRETILDALVGQTDQVATVQLRFGLCTPSQCNMQDMAAIAFQVSSALGVDAKILRCETKTSMALDTACRVIIGLMSLSAVLLLVGTFTEYLCGSGQSQGTKTPGPCLRFLISFSFLSNSVWFLRGGNHDQLSPKSLNCLAGIRFLSAAWNVLGNVFFLPSVIEFAHFGSKSKVLEIEHSFLHSSVSNFTLSYEAFFFVSGVLSAVCCLQKESSLGRVLRALFLDCLRWTLISLSVTLSVLLFSVLGSGPIYGDIVNQGRENCLANWWGNVVHISNFWEPKDSCLIHNWILSAALQVQLFCLPFLALPILKGWRRTGVVSILLLVSGSLLTTGLLSWYQDLAPALDGVTMDYRGKASELIGQVLIRPYTHLSVYVVGVTAALVLHHLKEAPIPRFVRWLCWLSCAVCWLGTVFGLHGHRSGSPLDLSLRALYGSLHRPVFALALAWVVVICGNGQARTLGRLLGGRVFRSLDLLSPTVFCLNPVVIMAHMSVTRERLYYGYETMVHEFLSSLCLTYVLSFVVHLCVEAPAITLFIWACPTSIDTSSKENSDILHSLPCTKMQDDTCVKVPFKAVVSRTEVPVEVYRSTSE